MIKHCYQLRTVSESESTVIAQIVTAQEAFTTFHREWPVWQREGYRLLLQLTEAGRERWPVQPITRGHQLALVHRFRSRHCDWVLHRGAPAYECHIVSDLGLPGEKHYLRSYRDSYRRAQIEFTGLWRRHHVRYGHDLWLECINPALVQGFYRKG